MKVLSAFYALPRKEAEWVARPRLVPCGRRGQGPPLLLVAGRAEQRPWMTAVQHSCLVDNLAGVCVFQ